MFMLLPLLLLTIVIGIPAAGLAQFRDKGDHVEVTANNAVAAGSVEDSLHACLARIPKDATPRQKMLAEQACRRAEADRAPVKVLDGNHVAMVAVGI